MQNCKSKFFLGRMTVWQVVAGIMSTTSQNKGRLITIVIINSVIEIQLEENVQLIFLQQASDKNKQRK